MCVPLANLEEIENFRPEDVPTVGMLLRELEALKLNSSNVETGWERTSLKKYVDIFDRHCEGIIKENRDLKKGLSHISNYTELPLMAFVLQRVLLNLWSSKGFYVIY